MAIIALEQVFEKQNFQVQAVLYGCEISTGEIGFELGIRQRNSIGNDYRYIVVDPRKPDKFETGALPKWQRKMIKVHKH